MDNTITIKVLPKDIKNGVRGDSNNCAIALTLKRMFPESSQIRVNGTFATFRQPKDYYSKYISLPPIAQTFIDDFDNGKEVKPFTFVSTINV